MERERERERELSSLNSSTGKRQRTALREDVCIGMRILCIRIVSGSGSGCVTVWFAFVRGKMFQSFAGQICQRRTHSNDRIPSRPNWTRMHTHTHTYQQYAHIRQTIGYRIYARIIKLRVFSIMWFICLSCICCSFFSRDLELYWQSK